MWGKRQPVSSSVQEWSGGCEAGIRKTGAAAGTTTTGERVPCLFSWFAIVPAGRDTCRYIPALLTHSSPTEADLLSDKSLTVCLCVPAERELKEEKCFGYSLQFAFCRTGFQDVRDGDGRVSLHKVGIVPSATDSDAEPIPGHSDQIHAVVLPPDAITSTSSLTERMFHLFVNMIVVVIIIVVAVAAAGDDGLGNGVIGE